jgi:hypothetical protein
MTRINLSTENLGDLEKEFPVLEPGDYDFVVANRLKPEKSKSSENKLIKVELQTTTPDGQQIKIFDNLVLTKNCEFKLFQFFKSLGLSDDDIKQGVDLDSLYMMPLKARIVQEIYQDESKNRVKRYLYEKA